MAPLELLLKTCGLDSKQLSKDVEFRDVWPQFAQWLLVDGQHGVIRHAVTLNQIMEMQNIAELYKYGGTVVEFMTASTDVCEDIESRNTPDCMACRAASFIAQCSVYTNPYLSHLIQWAIVESESVFSDIQYPVKRKEKLEAILKAVKPIDIMDITRRFC